MNTPGHTFRVAGIGDQTDIGFIWYGPIPGMSEQTSFLFDIYVDPPHRRKGYARDILQQMIEQVSATNRTTIVLNARSDNDAAIALYTDLGFERTNVSEDGKQIEMQLRL